MPGTHPPDAAMFLIPGVIVIAIGIGFGVMAAAAALALWWGTRSYRPERAHSPRAHAGRSVACQATAIAFSSDDAG